MTKNRKASGRGREVIARAIASQKSGAVKKIAALDKFAPAWIAAMSGIRGIVNAFWYVANAATQLAQNDSPVATGIVLKVHGIADTFDFQYPKGFNPFYNPEKPEDRGKHAVRPFLNYAAARAFPNDGARVLEVLASLMCWSARKVVKSRSQSKEGALMHQTLLHLESAGVTVESIVVGDEVYNRDAIMARGANLIRSLEVQREAGLLEVKRNPKRGAIKEGVTL